MKVININNINNKFFMKINHYDTETFIPTEQDFEEYHFKLAETIRCLMELKRALPTDVVSGIISDKEGSKLMIAFTRNRHNGDEIAEKYKITIEKISGAV